MDGATLALEKVHEAITAPSKWRRISVIQRQTVDQGRLLQARNLAKDVFGKIAPDGEDELDAFLRERLGAWKTNLDQYRALADTAHYPGGQEIADALGVIAKLLAEKESFDLIGKFLERKGDLLDLSEDVHELENFYESQRPTWEKLRKAYDRFQLNRKWLQRDEKAAAALKRMREILDASAPYGMIKEVDALIQTVDAVNTAMVTKRRGQVLERIEAHVTRIGKELDNVKAGSDLKNQSLYPLQALKQQVEKQGSIAHINQALSDAGDALDEAIGRIEAASQPTTPPTPLHVHAPGGTAGPEAGLQQDQGTKEPPSPVYVKKRRIVKAAQLAPEGYLETQADVDAYLDKLRHALEAAIAAGERIEIR